MMIIPLQPHAELGKRPWVTIAVCVICVLVYFSQEISRDKYGPRCSRFVNTFTAEDKQIVELFAEDPESVTCDLFETVGAYGGQSFPPAEFRHADEGIAQVLEELGLSEDVLWDRLLIMTDAYEKAGIGSLDEVLSYHYGSWNVFQMVSSIFAHANFEHLFFNLVLFWAFGCVVEMLVGSRWMMVVIVSSAILEAIVFNLAYQRGLVGATLGLSGVCMCMIGALFSIRPTARIKTFFWLLHIVRVVPIPAYWFAIWYVSWDIYDARFVEPGDNTNHSAHLSGAFLGATFGLFYMLRLTEKQASEKPVEFYD